MNDIVIANIRGLDLNLLLALDALYEERSVTRAADRLALTQPTVSGMLKRLREMFDDELYIRTSHGVVPTPRAEDLSKPVKDILDSAQALLQPPSFDPKRVKFDVNLCGSDYIHNTLLGPLAGEILGKAPGARVSLLPHPSGDPDMSLARGEVDILFTAHDLSSPRPGGLVLYRDNLACVSSYHTHKNGQEISLADLCTLSHVILAPFGSPISQKIDKMLCNRGLTRNIVTKVPNFAAVFQAMTHAQLIAFLPGQMANLYADQFKQLKVDLETPTTEVIARWHPRMNNDPRHDWVRERLQETVSKLAQQRQSRRPSQPVLGSSTYNVS